MSQSQPAEKTSYPLLPTESEYPPPNMEGHPQGQCPACAAQGLAPPISQDRARSPYLSQKEYHQEGANASYYSGEDLSGKEGEKGLGSTVVGGAAGGYAGHKLGGGGKLKTAGGALLGAIGTNMLTNKMHEHNHPQPAPVMQAAPAYGPGPQMGMMGGGLGLAPGMSRCQAHKARRAMRRYQKHCLY